ncbi:hypothetical protein MAHJHV60_46920 [Mycobacterium avium subsp. hominissuis]
MGCVQDWSGEVVDDELFGSGEGAAADDDRIWDAVELPNGRYQVRGDYFHTYTAAALEFLDDQAAAATTDLTAFLRDLLDTDRMRYAVWA